MGPNNTKKNGFYIDIGSSDYAYLLEHKYHCTGVCIDANPIVISNTIKDRPNSKCITALVWPYHTYLDFEIENNNNLSGRISNISYNPKFEGVSSTYLTEAKTIEQIFVENNIQPPDIIDYIVLDCNGSEIYLLDYLLNQNKFYITNISIKYFCNSYLQKLLEKIKNIMHINKIDSEYMHISNKNNQNQSVWISDRGFFSFLDKDIWQGFIDEKHINNLKLVDSNTHCVILSNENTTYKICNNELYTIISNDCHKITDGRWVSI